MLDQGLQEQLRSLLGQIPDELSLQLTLNDSEESRQLRQLAEQLSALSDKLHLAPEPGSDTRAPVLTLRSARGTSISFAGLPTGHEFTSLVLALLHSGGHPLKLEPEQQQTIRALDSELNVEIYVSLSCQTCPDVVQAFNMMAALNPRVRTVMLDGALFQQEVADRNILAVPTVYINGERFSQGRISLGDILRKLDSRVDQQATVVLDRKAPYDMLIVGGGPAGASAAIYAARKGLRTGLIADNFGGQVLDTLAIENFISVKATEGPKLVASLEEHVRDYAVDVMQGQRAAKVADKSSDGLFRVALESGATLRARSLVLATGARWRQLDVPGEREYKGQGVAYCPHCDGPLFKGQRVAVIGGGNSGIEAAIDLAGVVEHVTVLEYSDTLKADKVLVDKARTLANVDILTEAQTLAVEGDGRRVTGLRYHDRGKGSEHLLPLAGVFVQIGLIPNSDPVKDLLALSRFGEVITSSRGESSVPGIFAAGDVTDSAFKQIIIAMGSGATAALGAFEYLIRHSHELAPEAKAA